MGTTSDGEEAISTVALCVASSVAIFVILIFLGLQLSAHPYPNAFQNRLEVILLLCSALTIVLGLAYSFFLVQSIVVEIILMLVLISSLAGSLAFLAVKHRPVLAPVDTRTCTTPTMTGGEAGPPQNPRRGSLMSMDV